ncbi:MAG TPA: FAD-dependent monooxygenase [Ktedonobacterales bacterium]|jgi:2-polyprenyl-6-methoxyphenol hydroxylase-like FAD-dependent oxidoreductase
MSAHHEHQERQRDVRVLVIGGGIGGLCLAQGLKKAGIGVAVYERDGSAQFRNQGYRISLKADGSHALRDCLPEHLFDLSVATSIRSATRMVFMDHLLQPKFAQPLPDMVAPDPSAFGVNRLTLREILLAGLEDVVSFGKTFERFERLDDGRVRAYFADGTAADGDLLVGADGTASAVRQLLVPDAQIDILHDAMYGKTLITAETPEWMPDVLVDTFNNVIHPDGARMAVATCRTWEPVADATARLAPEICLTDVPGYFQWMLSLSDAYRDTDSLTLHRHATDLVRDWHPAMRRLIAEADIPSIFPVTVTSARPVDPWHAANVTLLGDAIHTMSPGRGEGANTALKDAEMLTHALIDVTARGILLTQAKAAYEEEMLRYGFAAVESSLQAPFAFRPSDH